MRKVVLTLKESEKYLTIKKLIETNGNKKIYQMFAEN